MKIRHFFGGLGILMLSVISGCSGGGGSSPSPAPPTNSSPVSDAGADQSVTEGDIIVLSGSASSDPDGVIASYAWTQTAGPPATLIDPTTATPSFQAPDVAAMAVLSFSLSVTDDDGASDTDTVDITINPSDRRVFTTLGVVEGETLASGVSVFRSIPYAEPPIGDLRWRVPRPHPPYNGVRETKIFGSNCWQVPNPFLPDNTDADDVSEDCLHLNVWSPDLDDAAGAPVMFWIHGGGNTAGTADKPLYDGEAYARDHGIVLISVKYRLGVLGYLAHRDLNIEGVAGTSGNYGLLDIITALEWTRDNVEKFGGDPNNVTIFGESAGAVNSCYMMTSPLATGLFDKVIMQSGFCSSPIQELDAPTDRSDLSAIESGDRVATALGCGGAVDILACMRAIPAEEIFAVLDLAGDVFFDEGDLYQVIKDGYVVPEDPLDIIAAGTHNRTPLLIGSNENEAGTWRTPIVALITGVTAYELILEDIYDDDANLILDGPSAEILAAYPASTEEEAEAAFQRLFTDASFTCTARRVARAMDDYTEPVWRYEFTRVPLAFADVGAFHGAELPYVFNTFQSSPIYGAIDERLSANILAYWANFARNGDPNESALPFWPQYFATTDEHMVLNEPLATGTRLRESYCDLFDNL